MTTIVITLPEIIPCEAERITSLLRKGFIDFIHIRKPGAKKEDIAAIIEQIPREMYSRLVLHDHHELAVRYGLFGIHLNSRNPLPPDSWQGSISRSCHSLKELEEWKPRCNYVSLSPIFNSISKQGYLSAFTPEKIRQAHEDGIIDEKVFALGGVTFQRLEEVREMGFGGAMILGDAWK